MRVLEIEDDDVASVRSALRKSLIDFRVLKDLAAEYHAEKLMDAMDSGIEAIENLIKQLD